jgi:mono/diheme cytochrome c family protein/glucose/arabinose dehydrogenase
MLVCFLLALLAGCREERSWPPGVQEVPPGEAPVLSPGEALETFHLPPGYRLEVVAAEPLVQDPVALDFDADGRLYVVEMRGYMPNLQGKGEDRPVGRVVVLEDTDDDGRMDRRRVYLDSLVLPRAVKVLSRGVLVAAPPYLWLTRDTDGDGRADTREVVRDDYGDPGSNPEHNANGLAWGLDNWIHNAKYGGQLRLRGGRFEHREIPALGQWGVSMDDYGRLYRNYNEDPLHVDLVSPHYAARNPNLTRTRGIYEELTENGPVWPVRPTPGVNRGYREKTLRDDSTLAHFTAAGSPVAYRGDRLPEELSKDVFVTEPAGNLVRRFRVAEGADGVLEARNAYDGAEFLASTDERFRPVNLYSAPDGTLYVVDMYRGIIQHRRYVTGYLEEQVRARGLEEPIGLGRIYRVVHRSTRRGERPRLSGRPTAELVGYLSHPNGWWRETAQRLLVERGDRSVVPALRQAARGAQDERARLHALWTLEGLGAADPPALLAAVRDHSPRVRAAAVRISEPWLSHPGHPLRDALLRAVDDPRPEVRRQLAASLGELPLPEREEALGGVVRRHGGDPVVVDLVVSGLHGREAGFLERLLADSSLAAERGEEGVKMLAAAVMKSQEDAAIQRIFRRAGEERRPRWQRLAILDGVDGFLPEPQGEGEEGRPVALSRRPAGLLEAAASPDPAVRARAGEIVPRVSWPGKPRAPRPPARPLTPEEQARFRAGERQYLAKCAGCHQPGGTGKPGVAKRLVGSKWVLGPPGRLIRIVLHGKEGEMLMPPVGGSLSDEEAAAVLTYVRRAWGHQAAPIDAAQIHEVRGQTAGRELPWLEHELLEIER